MSLEWWTTCELGGFLTWIFSNACVSSPAHLRGHAKREMPMGRNPVSTPVITQLNPSTLSTVVGWLFSSWKRYPRLPKGFWTRGISKNASSTHPCLSQGLFQSASTGVSFTWLNKGYLEDPVLATNRKVEAYGAVHFWRHIKIHFHFPLISTKPCLASRRNTLLTQSSDGFIWIDTTQSPTHPSTQSTNASKNQSNQKTTTHQPRKPIQKANKKNN